MYEKELKKEDLFAQNLLLEDPTVPYKYKKELLEIEQFLDSFGSQLSTLKSNIDLNHSDMKQKEKELE